MPHRIHRHENRVTVDVDDRTVEVTWNRNRFHYHPRIYRLVFAGFESLPTARLLPCLQDALAELRAAPGPGAALLFRTTLDARSGLLPALRQCGFLETRRVYEPVLPLAASLPTILRQADPPAPDEPLRVTPFTTEHRDDLLDVLTEVYARTARLDPATPDRLDRQELWTAFMRDLDPELSTCAYIGDTLVGTCTIYRTEDPGEVELGPFGVTRPHLASHRDMTLTMLRRSILQAHADGVRRLRAEIDSDDPWTLYTCAELPFVRDGESVSLAFAPAWQT